MAVRVSTTHIWSKVFVPITWISRIIAIIIVIGLLETIMPNNVLGVIVFITAFFVTIIIHALTIEQWYHIIQTYLYVRINLGTKISIGEAKHFIVLFAPTEMGFWYPMTGIKDLPKSYRRKVLFDSARKIYAEAGYEFGIDINDSRYESKQATIGDEYEHMKDTAYFFSGHSDLIAMLCKMAKGDGVVTEDEIAVVDDFFINVLKLSPEKRREAIDIFQKSKQSDTPFEVYAREFYSKHKEKKELLEAAIDLLTCVAFADGELSAEEEILLNQAIIIFGVDASRYKEYKEAYNEREVTSTDAHEERYYARILGLQDDITPEKVKSSYRKLAVQYHPDKVSHLGIKIKKVAESEMKKINEAYDYFQKQYSL